jgi:hypothetical protein
MRSTRAIPSVLTVASLLAVAGCATATQQLAQGRCDGPPVVTIRNGLAAAVEVYAQIPSAGNRLIGVVEAGSTSTFDGMSDPGVTYAIRYRPDGRSAALNREQSERVRLSVSCP